MSKVACCMFLVMCMGSEILAARKQRKSEDRNAGITVLNCVYGYSQCLGLQRGDSLQTIQELGCQVDEDGDTNGQNQNRWSLLFGARQGISGSSTMPYMDGMPCTFSPDSDRDSLDSLKVSDIQVELDTGEFGTVSGATWLPANERNEMLTLLMLGNFGWRNGANPKKVTILGSSFQGPSLNYANEGLEIVWARWFTEEDDYKLEGTGNLLNTVAGNSCQARWDDTTHVVQVAFNGGVSLTFNDNQRMAFAPNNDLHKNIFRLMMGKSELSDAEYLGFADEADGDNFIDLCLKLSDDRVSDIQKDAKGLKVRFLSTRECVFAVPPKGDCLNDMISADCGDSSTRPQEICVHSIPDAATGCDWNSAQKVNLTAEDLLTLQKVTCDVRP